MPLVSLMPSPSRLEADFKVVTTSSCLYAQVHACSNESGVLPHFLLFFHGLSADVFEVCNIQIPGTNPSGRMGLDWVQDHVHQSSWLQEAACQLGHIGIYLGFARAVQLMQQNSVVSNVRCSAGNIQYSGTVKMRIAT